MKLRKTPHLLQLSLMLLLLGLACGKNDPASTEDGGGNGNGTDTVEQYTLFNPNNAKTTYLIKMDGTVVHEWVSTRGGGYSVYLLENGDIIRPALASNVILGGGGSAGCVQQIDWDGDVVWEFTYSNSSHLAHHDIEPMPNGNVLLIAWEVKSAAEVLAAGRKDDAVMWPDHVIEVEPTGSNTGSIVWEWHAWDHLIQDYSSTRSNYGVVADHPELIDVNLGSGGVGPANDGDWLHLNGISYNSDLDQIVLSSHFMNEIYVIDHSTTTEEAAGHTGGKSGRGGDILYRWGSPSNYDAAGTGYFDVCHCAWWIPADLAGGGNILVFNNGENQRASSIIEITPPLDENGAYTIVPGTAYGPSQPTWTYSNGTNFYSSNMGGCQRLPDGNTLIVESTKGHFFEVTDSGEVVWRYSYGSEVARALRYQADYPGLSRLANR
ncbi:MAG: aryl-sulfate sulfotransferase [Candidatus Krumholzibacteria bacterium]|nr:aryl-sulfate sulfotransferase [Candidatus Krumholzibacteria bacterium]